MDNKQKSLGNLIESILNSNQTEEEKVRITYGLIMDSDSRLDIDKTTWEKILSIKEYNTIRELRSCAYILSVLDPLEKTQNLVTKLIQIDPDPYNLRNNSIN